mgnify:CR=1 FL=1
MWGFLKAFWYEEDGLGTVEIIIIIAVLVAVALVFRNQIITFVTDMMDKVFPNTDDIKSNKDIEMKNVN